MTIKLTKISFLIAVALSVSAIAQNNCIEKIDPVENFSLNTQLKSTSIATTCIDQNKYVGTSASYLVKLGGKLPNRTTVTAQIFSGYYGAVNSVAFAAAKGSTNSPNYTCSVRIHGLNGSGGVGNPIGTVANVAITSGSISTYTVNFPSPVNVPQSSNGFAVVINYNSTNTDSMRIAASASLTTPIYRSEYSSLLSIGYLTVYNSLVPFDFHFLIWPTYTIDNNSGNYAISRTTPSCVIPANYQFALSGKVTPSYYFNQDIIQSPTLESLNFGDNTFFSLNNASKTYSANGQYLAVASRTFFGWTNNCIDTHTYNVIVGSGNTNPAFTFNANGFNLVFNNTSTNAVSYNWNFGDLTTSTQTNPSKTYSSPGTYVVELTAFNANGCSKKYIESIIVSSTTDINDKASLSSQIKLYPNPAHEKITFYGNSYLKGKFAIYDLIGKKIISEKEFSFIGNEFAIDISDLEKGSYIMKGETSDGNFNKIFIKE